MDDDTSLPTVTDTGRRRVSTLEHLADIPEELGRGHRDARPR
jgi:hypothetical protein